MNWGAVRQKVVEWGVVALLGFIVGVYAEIRRLELEVAQHDVYIDMLWKQKP
jgi:hypothetical protein